MSAREKLIKARMGMLALAEELSNVSKACQRAGISRSHFYEIKEAYEKYGREGLAPEVKRQRRMPNQTPPELEAQILAMTERVIRVASLISIIGQRRWPLGRPHGAAAPPGSTDLAPFSVPPGFEGSRLSS